MSKKFYLLVIFGLVIPSIMIFVSFLVMNNKMNETPDTLDAIIKRDSLIVGVATDTKPFGFIDENGKNAGFDIDIARRIAKHILKNDSKVEFVPVSMADRMLKLNKGDVDFVIASLTITPQRSQVVDFSAPYYIAGQAIMVNRDSKIRLLGDLTGDPVGVVFGTTGEKNIRNLLPTSKIVGYKDLNEAFNALKNQKIVALTADDVVLRPLAINDTSVRILPKRYSREPYGIAFRKDSKNNKLKEQVAFVLSDMKGNNEIQKLMKKWGID